MALIYARSPRGTLYPVPSDSADEMAKKHRATSTKRAYNRGYRAGRSSEGQR